MTSKRRQAGFSLIELLFVLVIIAALAAIAIPGYIGMQNRAHETSIVSTARSSIDTLTFWLHSSLSPRINFRELDTNFDSLVDIRDKTNLELQTDGVVKTFVDGRNTILKDKSPWNPDIPLWSNDPSMPNSRITVLQISNYEIRMFAKNYRGEIVFERQITAD